MAKKACVKATLSLRDLTHALGGSLATTTLPFPVAPGAFSRQGAHSALGGQMTIKPAGCDQVVGVTFLVPYPKKIVRH